MWSVGVEGSLRSAEVEGLSEVSRGCDVVKMVEDGKVEISNEVVEGISNTWLDCRSIGSSKMATAIADPGHCSTGSMFTS